MQLVIRLVILCIGVLSFSVDAKVLVSIKPLYNLVAAVTQDIVETELLLKGNKSPHHYTLKPSQRKLLGSADLVIWGGKELEPYLAKIITRVSKELDLSLTPSLMLLKQRQNMLGSNCCHSATRVDPHFWLSISNSIKLVKNIAKQLKTIYPGHSVQLDLNVKKFSIKARAKSLKIKLKLKKINRPFLTFHDAYQYFEQDYGLNNIGIIVGNNNLTPGIKRVTLLQDIAAKHPGICVFKEPKFSAKIMKNLEGIKQGTLDPLGKDLDIGVDGYFKLIDNLTNDFLSCMDG